MQLGVPTGVRGALVVDEQMRTAVPGTWAAGDCVHTHHRLLEQPTYLPLGTTAHKQGRVAGENAIGGERRFAGVLGTQVVKVFDQTIRVCGDQRTGRLLGAQIAGGLSGQEAKRIDVFAAALHHEMTVEALSDLDLSCTPLSDLDLSYTPPFGAPWDAI